MSFEIGTRIVPYCSTTKEIYTLKAIDSECCNTFLTFLCSILMRVWSVFRWFELNLRAQTLSYGRDRKHVDELANSEGRPEIDAPDQNWRRIYLLQME